MMRRASSLVVVALVLGACSKDKGAGTKAPPPPPRTVSDAAVAQDSPSETAKCDIAQLPARLPAAERVVAIGDLHGDLNSTEKVLEVAGLSRNGKWIGGETILVQTGDVLDRGDDEREIFELLFSLREQAEIAGGKVVLLNGNHELMNAALDFRYVTPGGYADWNDPVAESKAELARVPKEMRGRALAFAPGGPWAKKLAELRTAVIVGDTVFVHGGITPRFARDGLARMNHETRCFLRGDAPPPGAMTDPEGPVWTRRYSSPRPPCDELAGVLKVLGVKRMVVGHTPQLKGVTEACGGTVWRVDVGLAKHYGGPAQALEIRGDNVKVLK